MKILGLSGSLRRGSYNSGLLRAAAELVPAQVEIEIASIRDIPLYDADLETGPGTPAAVVALKQSIVAADGLLIATPEYNNSVPGVLKNTIDWLSRPPSDAGRIFGGRLVAVMGASPGIYGTVQAQTAWLPIMRTLRMHPWLGPRLAVANAGAVFDDSGTLKDEKVRVQLREFVQGFVQFIEASRAAKSPSSA
jgi:chromate reductase, NAD(P)H dehydrogenase (quinone)